MGTVKSGKFLPCLIITDNELIYNNLMPILQKINILWLKKPSHDEKSGRKY